MTQFEIEGGYPLNGTIIPSGNKNEALPALASCLLTDEDVVLKRTPQIKDVLTMCEILRKLGVKVEWQDEDTLFLNAKDVKFSNPDTELCSRVRASILLLGPLLSRFKEVKLPPPGGDVIGARRIDSHFECIRGLGGKLDYGPPIHAKIGSIQGKDVFLDEPSVTATENFLMLAARCQGESTLHNAASEPHVVGLCRLLNSMGAEISGVGSNCLHIKGQEVLRGTTHTIGPDFMEVGSFLSLGAISEGTIKIENVIPKDLRLILKTLGKLGIRPTVGPDYLEIERQPLTMEMDLGKKIATIASGPWPSFPSDLMSVTIVAGTQANGTMIFHEKMFEGRLFFTDKLMSMGANIVLCDPHRVVVTGPTPLKATHMSTPDVRAGMAMLIAAAISEGKSVIDNIYQIERGYFQIEKKLEALGAKIKKIK